MAKYKFKDIAFNSTEKKKPVEEDKYHYIGLEHLDSQCLNVNRYGSEVAPVGDKLIMKKGDILFGKRRAYQKKVAIAPFDGIFSAHGFVLRPKEEVVDKDFFPFFISSDYFLDKAISISVGSLSPTINWTDLKDVEFELPDLQEQKTLAKILLETEEVMLQYKNLIKKAKDLYQEKIKKIQGLYDLKPIESLTQKCKLQKADVGTVPYLEIGDVDIDKKCYTLKDKPSVSGANFVVKDDILISLVRPTRGAIVRVDDECISASNAFCVLRGNSKLINEYLFNYLIYNLDFFKSFENKQFGSTYPTCKENDVLEYLVPMPATDENLSCLTDELKCATKTINLLTNKLKTMKNIENQIIKEALYV